MWRVSTALVAVSLVLAACNDEGGPSRPSQPIPKTKHSLLEFTPPPEPEPEPEVAPEPPQERIVYVERPAPPPPPPPPPPAPEPEVVLVPPPFDDPADAARAAMIRQHRLARAQAGGKVYQAELDPPQWPEPDAKWRLSDPDYSRDGMAADTSTLPVDRYRVITNDRYITAILENSVNSQIPGRFIAIVERHVYGADGRIPLLPKGTRIVCHYESLAKQGDSRLAGNCSRAIRPDGASIVLSDAAAADQVARTGLIGEVDNRNWQRYGTAVVVSALSAVAAAGSAISDSPYTDAGATALSQNLGQVTATALQNSIDLAPIVTVPAGSRIQIIPEADIWLRKPEPLNQQAEQQQ
jgi:type IV secretion system protein VirB10